MTEYKNEYQKFADSAVRGRAEEEGYGRLRLGVFWGAVGPLAIFLTHMLHFEPLPRWAAMAIVAAAPLAVILTIVNYIRLPNECKAQSKAIMIAFITILGAGANIALANYFELFKIISPP